MLTATARKHIVRALREALLIREPNARAILETIRNDNMLRLLRNEDLRTVKALVSIHGSHPEASLYLDHGQGYEQTGVALRLDDADIERWSRLPLEEAYAIAGEISDNAGPGLRAADERMAAEAAELAAMAANDDLLPEEEMDRTFGPVPESRDYAWTDGTLRAVAVAPSGDHVVATVEVGFGDSDPVAMAMFPLFSGVADLAAYASGRIGKPARLCVGRINAFDQDVPAGFDRSMPVLDMIVDRRDVPGLTRLHAKAA